MLDLSNFKPCFLVAMPQLQDPHFHQAVVLLAEYNEKGAFGLVLNRPINKTLGEVERPEAPVDKRLHDQPVWFGGPVSLDTAMVVFESHSQALLKSMEGKVSALGSDLYITGNTAVLTTHADGLVGAPFKVIAGHAAWGVSQLDNEIAQSTWLVAPMSKPLIYSEYTTMWDRAIRSLGVDPRHLTMADSELLN